MGYSAKKGQLAFIVGIKAALNGVLGNPDEERKLSLISTAIVGDVKEFAEILSKGEFDAKTLGKALLEALASLSRKPFDVEEECFLAIIDECLVQEAEVSSCDVKGSSSLHYAARCGSRYVESLLSVGASVSALNSEGESPLHWAVSSQRADSCSALLAAGANPIEFGKCRRGAFAEAYSDEIWECVESWLSSMGEESADLAFFGASESVAERFELTKTKIRLRDSLARNGQNRIKAKA